MSLNFYRDLQGFSQFSRLTDAGHYVAAPADWHILATDIEGSTRAIAEGRYKEINLVGAAVVMAILNITGDIAVPYVFAGDGASMLIPPELVAKARDVLGAICAKVNMVFGLELRAGLIPLATLYENNAWLKVGKFNLSPHVSQAFFQGTALSLAEKWLKSGNSNVTYGAVKSDTAPDLDGLECRWQPLKSRNGRIVSLLVKAVSDHEGDSSRIYADILRGIEAIFPDHARTCPSYRAGIRLSFSPLGLLREAKIRSGATFFRQASYLIRMLIENALGQYSFSSGKTVGAFNGQQYLSQLIANSDCRKFDEMLRMVIDTTPHQQEALERMLQEHRASGEIAYGLHVSSAALMTCLIFNRGDNHVHFVDGADGGYALAALQMKRQYTEMAEKSGNSAS